MQAPFIPRCQSSLHMKTRPNVAERWIVSMEKFHLWNVGPMLRAARAKPERGDKKERSLG